jgi:hypothetical protein
MNGDWAETAVYGIGTGGGMALGLAFIKWFGTFLAGRVDKQQARVDAGTQALIAGLNTRLAEEKESRLAEIARRVKVEEEMRLELRGMREALHECERKHADSEARVKQLEATMLGFGDAKQQAQRIISADKIARKGREE